MVNAEQDTLSSDPASTGTNTEGWDKELPGERGLFYIGGVGGCIPRKQILTAGRKFTGSALGSTPIGGWGGEGSRIGQGGKLGFSLRKTSVGPAGHLEAGISPVRAWGPGLYTPPHQPIIGCGLPGGGGDMTLNEGLSEAQAVSRDG